MLLVKKAFEEYYKISYSDFTPLFMSTNNIDEKNTPRNVFLHLFSIVTLYLSAISFITLMWQYINYLFPDHLESISYIQWSIRFAVSTLIIAFPFFILSSWYLNKLYKQEKWIRSSKIRKWLIYLTLFITSLIIIGDLISIINVFLSGETTVRFILKASVVLLVTALIFGYYLDDIKRVDASPSAKYFALTTSVFVSLSLVAVFFIIGSPQKERLVKFDQQKIMDLQNIQWQIINYWQRKEKLPTSLEELNDPLSGYVLPLDPQTKSSYEYIVKDKDNLQFQLCAIFNLNGEKKEFNNAPSPIYDHRDYFLQNWEYRAGRFCFERKIDKDFYPPFNAKQNTP